METETREIVEFKSEMSMKEYLQLLGENECYDQQFCYIAFGQVKIHQTKQLMKLLLKGIEANRNGKFNNTEFVNSIRDMMLKHTEELEELLDLYKIIYKSNYIDENETNKAHIYFDSELLKGEAETNINILIEYICKLKIEIKIVDRGTEPFVKRWCNYEDVYDRP
jgi:hypothetical protein